MITKVHPLVALVCARFLCGRATVTVGLFRFRFKLFPPVIRLEIYLAQCQHKRPCDKVLQGRFCWPGMLRSESLAGFKPRCLKTSPGLEQCIQTLLFIKHAPLPLAALQNSITKVQVGDLLFYEIYQIMRNKLIIILRVTRCPEFSRTVRNRNLGISRAPLKTQAH